MKTRRETKRYINILYIYQKIGGNKDEKRIIIIYKTKINKY